MHTNWFKTLLFFTASAPGLSVSSIGESVTIAGTDLFSEVIVSAIEDSIAAGESDTTLQFKGTMAAVEALESGSAQAAFLAVVNSDVEWPASYRRYPVGSQVVVLAVHSDNPVTQVTLDQLNGIFSSNGTLLNWSSLTDDPLWADKKISPYKADSDELLSEELFSSSVLQYEDFKQTVRTLLPDIDAIAATLSDDQGSIVLLDGLNFVEPMRSLAVAASDSTRAALPTIDNIFFGDYPLRLPFELVVSPDLPNETLKRLLESVYSDSMTAILSASGFQPIPDPEKASILASIQ